MKYFAIEFANHTTLLVKADRTKESIIRLLSERIGIVSINGDIYNPKSFLKVSFIPEPDTRQQLVAIALDNALIG